MNDYLDSQIQCPFFVSESKLLLCCEGLLDTTCMTTSFPEKEAKLQHIDCFCRKKDGGNCPMATSLFEKYRRIGEKQTEEERLKRMKLLDTLVYTGKISFCHAVKK